MILINYLIGSAGRLNIDNNICIISALDAMIIQEVCIFMKEILIQIYGN